MKILLALAAVLFSLTLVPSLGAQAPPQANAAVPAEEARWPGPTLTSPTVVQVPTTGLDRAFGATEDVVLDLPAQPVTGQVSTSGGDDIRVVGGQIGDGATFDGSYGIVARDLRGSLYIEGVLIDFSQVVDKDNIVATGYSPCRTSRAGWTYPEVYVQNSRLLGSKYSGGAMHPDLVQKQGPMGSFYSHNVTGESSYQGYQLSATSFSSSCAGNAPQEAHTEGLKNQKRSTPGEAIISNTNLRHRADQTSGYLAWLTWDAGANGSFHGEDPWPTTLENFWVQGRPQGDRRLCCNLLWPRTLTPLAEHGADVKMTLSADKRSATWEPGAQIRGTASEGDPPDGDFSPVGMAGLTYTPRDIER